MNRRETQKNLGFSLGQNIYTPREIEAPVPDPNDRPYAGWSYLEVSFVSKTQRRVDILSFQAGIVGPSSLAEETQRLVHEWIHSDDPQGWDSQLRDESGFGLIAGRWQLAGTFVQRTREFATQPERSSRFGSVTLSVAF